VSTPNTKESKINRYLRRQADMDRKLDSLITVLHHFRRVLNEKTTLQKQLDAARTVNRGLAEANRYMAMPKPRDAMSMYAPDFEWKEKLAADVLNFGFNEATAPPKHIPTLSLTATGDFDCNCKPGYPHDPDCAWWDRKMQGEGAKVIKEHSQS
jgi:hypothetical protein